MQTIARANRVFGEKQAGIIVDYVGVFRNLQKALAVYAAPVLGGGGGSPVADKSELVEMLTSLLGQMRTFIKEHGIDKDKILEVETLERIALLDHAVEQLIVNDEVKKKFVLQAGHILQVFKAIKPDAAANEHAAECVMYAVIAEKIRALATPADISEVMARVEEVLDESIAAQGYVIKAASAEADPTAHLVDLTEIDFDKLRRQFQRAPLRSVVERLRSLLGARVEDMVRLNRSRTNYLEQFQRLIDEYNSGSVNLKEFFDRLVKFTAELDTEDRRAVGESLTDEELALFDLLTKPDPKLTKKQEAEVKKVAKALLETLKHRKLVLDWRKKQQTRQAVRLCIEEELDKLPEVYERPIYERKCEEAYRHVYDSYFGEGQSIYGKAA